MNPSSSSVLLNDHLSYSYSENPEEAVRDPVAAYRLLRRMRSDFMYIVKRIQPNLTQCEEYQNELDSKIPQRKDLDGAASGLIRLQEIYKLHPEDITKGKPSCSFAHQCNFTESFTFQYELFLISQKRL